MLEDPILASVSPTKFHLSKSFSQQAAVLKGGNHLGGTGRPPLSGSRRTPTPPTPVPSQTLSSFSPLRSRYHQPNLPPFTSDTLSGDSNANSGARAGPVVEREKSLA